jgi:hypothetical protein
MYAIFDRRGNPNLYTLNDRKKDCILTFFGSMEDYQESKNKGWICKKLNVTITEL